MAASTWTRAQLVAQPLCISSELMTRPIPSQPPPHEGTRCPPSLPQLVLWFPIIGAVPSLSHVTCWGRGASVFLSETSSRKVSSLKSCRRCGSPPPNPKKHGDRPAGPTELLVHAEHGAPCQTPLPSHSRTTHMLFSYCRLTALTSRACTALTYLLHERKKKNKTQQPTRELCFFFF